MMKCSQFLQTVVVLLLYRWCDSSSHLNALILHDNVSSQEEAYPNDLKIVKISF